MFKVYKKEIVRIPKKYKNGFLQKCTVEIGIKKIKFKIDRTEWNETNETNETKWK